MSQTPDLPRKTREYGGNERFVKYSLSPTPVGCGNGRAPPNEGDPGGGGSVTSLYPWRMGLQAKEVLDSEYEWRFPSIYALSAADTT
jgi:hypothetical protein